MVKVNFLQGKTAILAALAAKISQNPLEKGDIATLYQETVNNEENSRKFVEAIMKNNRHLIFGDFLPYAISLESISRFAAIYFWRNVSAQNLVFGAGIETSLRLIKPNQYVGVVSTLGKKALQLYQEAINLGASIQDARYLLPEGVLTRMIFTAPPRYLIKIANSLKEKPLRELQEIAQGIEKIVKNKIQLEIPKEPSVSDWKIWGREKIKEETRLNYQGEIFSTSLVMGLRGSLAMLAQLVRQRPLLCQLEPLEEIAKNGTFVVPPTFPQKIKEEYKKLAKEAIKEQRKLIKKRDTNFVYFLLLGQEAGVKVFGFGPSIIETARARIEGVAQWEIRNKFGLPLTKELLKHKELEKEIGPRCWRERRCIEPLTFKTKKATCPIFLKGWQGKTLKELLEILKTDYETFTV